MGIAERCIELLTGLLVVVATGAWLLRGVVQKRLGHGLVWLWGSVWVLGSAASYWALWRAAATLRATMPPEQRQTQFTDWLARSLDLLTAARLALIVGFMAALAVRFWRPRSPAPAGAPPPQRERDPEPEPSGDGEGR